MTEQTPEGATPEDTTKDPEAPQEGQEAPQEAASTTPDPESTDDENGPENGPQGLRAQHDAAQEVGVLGPLAPNDGPNAILAADEAAPQGFSEDRKDAVVGDLEDHRLNTAKAVPLQDTKPLPVKGESYRQGYAGTLPNEDDRPDLTLAGVTARDYPDAETGETGQPVQGS